MTTDIHGKALRGFFCDMREGDKNNIDFNDHRMFTNQDNNSIRADTVQFDSISRSFSLEK